LTGSGRSLFDPAEQAHFKNAKPRFNRSSSVKEKEALSVEIHQKWVGKLKGVHAPGSLLVLEEPRASSRGGDSMKVLSAEQRWCRKKKKNAEGKPKKQREKTRPKSWGRGDL